MNKEAKKEERKSGEVEVEGRNGKRLKLIVKEPVWMEVVWQRFRGPLSRMSGGECWDIP